MHPALHAKLSEVARVGVKFLQLACFVHLFNEHVFEVRSCAGPSMYPTLALSGDYLLSIRTSFLKTFLHRRAPHVERGDLIDFVSPRDPSYSACKRVIGVEGDVVCLDPSDTATSEFELRETPKSRTWIKVPTGYLWVAGDNLSNSNDSREYGPLPLGLVRGKIVARIWPNPRWFTGEKNEFTRIS